MRLFAAAASDLAPKSLRQKAESTSVVGTATSLKAEFLTRAAQWAATVVPSLGAFLGARLAAACETAGVEPPVAPPQLICQKCESILQPSVNCSVSGGVAANTKSKGSVYRCNYCGYRTVKAAVKKKIGKAGATNKKSSSGSASVGGRPAQTTPNSGKKRKRKGWSSLKDLATASATQSPQNELNCALRPQKKSTMSTSHETVKSVVSSSKFSLDSRAGSPFSDEKQVLSDELGATTVHADNSKLKTTTVREEPPEALSSHQVNDGTTQETVVKASDSISSPLSHSDKTKEQTFESSTIVEANFKLPALRKAVHIDSTGGHLSPSQAQSAADSDFASLTIEGSGEPAETEKVTEFACTEMVSAEALPEFGMLTQETITESEVLKVTSVKETVTECEMEVRTECKSLETAFKPELPEAVCISQMQDTLTETEMVGATGNCDKLETVNMEIEGATTEPELAACEVLETRMECDVEQVATECEKPMAEFTVSEHRNVHVSQDLENPVVVMSAGQDEEKLTADIVPELPVSEAKQMDSDAVDHISPVASVPPLRLKDVVRSFLHARRLQSARHALYLGAVKRQFKVVGARCKSLGKQKLQRMTKLAMSEKRRADNLTIELQHSTQNLLRSKRVAVALSRTQLAHLRRQLCFLPELKESMNQLSGEMTQLCGELRKVIEALEQTKNHAHCVSGATTGTDTGNVAEVEERARGVELDKQISAADQTAPFFTAAVETAPKKEATNKSLGVSSLSKNIKKKGLRASVGCGIFPIKGRMMLSKIGRRWMISEVEI